MKRILSLLLALITVLSVPVTASAATTAHKGASSWAIESIVEAEKIGLIPQELYPLKYKEAITREEFASLIADFCGYIIVSIYFKAVYCTLSNCTRGKHILRCKYCRQTKDVKPKNC